MKISKKKKLKIADIIKKFLPSKDGLLLFAQIIEILEAPENRSLKSNHLYWAFMKWCSHNINIPQLEIIPSDKLVHELCKARMEITSTAFDALDEKQFQEYFDSIREWLATRFFDCDGDTLMREFLEGVK